METSSHQPEPPDHKPSEGTTITDEYPEWETWAGTLAGLLYAKRRDPQMVVRATSTEGLRTEIERAEQARGLR